MTLVTMLLGDGIVEKTPPELLHLVTHKEKRRQFAKDVLVLEVEIALIRKLAFCQSSVVQLTSNKFIKIFVLPWKLQALIVLLKTNDLSHSTLSVGKQIVDSTRSNDRSILFLNSLERHGLVLISIPNHRRLSLNVDGSDDMSSIS